MFITIDQEKGLTCSDGLTIGDALRLVGTATLYMLQSCDADFKEKAETEEEYNEAHGKLYDMYNFLAGNILDKFDGDRSPSTDLTAQAILEAENAILDRQAPKEEDPA